MLAWLNPSRRPLQIDRLGAYHEDERVQDLCQQQVPDCQRVPAQAAGIETGRSSCALGWSKRGVHRRSAEELWSGVDSVASLSLPAAGSWYHLGFCPPRTHPPHHLGSTSAMLTAVHLHQRRLRTDTRRCCRKPVRLLPDWRATHSQLQVRIADADSPAADVQ